MDAKGYASLAYERGWDVTDLAEMLANRDRAIENLRESNASLADGLRECKRGKAKLLDRVHGNTPVAGASATTVDVVAADATVVGAVIRPARVRLVEEGGQIGGTMEEERTVQDGA
jgi:hypothetical protein